VASEPFAACCVVAVASAIWNNEWLSDAAKAVPANKVEPIKDNPSTNDAVCFCFFKV
jgi:hypothetical protein